MMESLEKLVEVDVEHQRAQWEEFYRNSPTSCHDDWLEKYVPLFTFDREAAMLDLGCGNGGNIPFLLERGGAAFARDYSEAAIGALRERYPRVQATVVDMREPLPYNDHFFDVVLADLSLHYFYRETTLKIAEELRRILKPGAILLARLNSTSDLLHGYGRGEEVERGLFLYEGRLKRFFDREMIYELFSVAFEVEEAQERQSEKYVEMKHLWEVVLRARNRILR